MAMLPLMHLAQVSIATNHRTHLASWVPITHAWYTDATAAHLTQGIFLLMKSVRIAKIILLRVFLYTLTIKKPWQALGASAKKGLAKNQNCSL